MRIGTVQRLIVAAPPPNHGRGPSVSSRSLRELPARPASGAADDSLDHWRGSHPSTSVREPTLSRVTPSGVAYSWFSVTALHPCDLGYSGSADDRAPARPRSRRTHGRLLGVCGSPFEMAQTTQLARPQNLQSAVHSCDSPLRSELTLLGFIRSRSSLMSLHSMRHFFLYQRAARNGVLTWAEMSAPGSWAWLWMLASCTGSSVIMAHCLVAYRQHQNLFGDLHVGLTERLRRARFASTETYRNQASAE